MAVFDPTQGFNAFAQGAQIGGNIRQRQTEAKLAPMVAAGDYQGAAQYAGQRGDLQGAELYRTQYMEALKAANQEDILKDKQRRQGIASVAMGGMNVPEEYLPLYVQENAGKLKEYGIPDEQIAQWSLPGTLTHKSLDGFVRGAMDFDQQVESYLAQTKPVEGKAINNRLVNPFTAEVMGDYSDAEGPLSTMGKLAADLQAGRITPEQYEMEIGRMQRSDPSFSVEFGEGGALAGITYGSAPKGQEAAVVRGADGQALVAPGPQQEAYNKAVRGFEEFKAQNSIVVQDIDRALGAISGWSTGAGAALKDLPIVGGITPAGQLESLLSTIQANVGFDKLQAMREASPTGGALGSVTEKELAFLQSVFGSLRQDTSAENVRFNLTRLKQHMQGREARIQAAMAADFPTLAETAQFRGQTNAQIQALSAEEEAERQALRAELGME